MSSEAKAPEVSVILSPEVAQLAKVVAATTSVSTTQLVNEHMLRVLQPMAQEALKQMQSWT